MSAIRRLIDAETLVEWEGMVSFDVNLHLAEDFTSKWKEQCVKTFDGIVNRLRGEIKNEALSHFRSFPPEGLPNRVR
jgi:hypothetical protein